MTSSEQIARKPRGPQMHKEHQLVRIPRRERIEIERGLRKMDFERYYQMRHQSVYEYVDKDGTKHTDELEEHYLPVMLAHGNLKMRETEHDALLAILGKSEPWEPREVKKGHKWCGGGCERELELTIEFWQRSKQRKDGFQNWCRDCMGVYQSKYRARNRARRAESA